MAEDAKKQKCHKCTKDATGYHHEITKELKKGNRVYCCDEHRHPVRHIALKT